jgi:tetratricopeptide (TPR) repeat protein
MDGDPRPAPAPGGGARVALLLATALTLALAVFAGDVSADGTLHTVGGLAVVAAAVALVLALRGRLPLPGLDAAGRVALGAVLGLGVWVGLSIAWSIAPDASWAWLNRSVVYAALLVLGLLVGALAHGRADLAWILAGVLGAAIGWSLLGVAVPALAEDGDRVARLREPVGYWNGLALLADAGIALGLWIAAGGRGWRRATGVLLVFGSVVVVALTQSRAGVLAALAVLALVLALAPRRLEVGLLLVCGAAPAVAVAAWAFTRPALVEDGAGRAARVDDGRLFALAVGVGALVAVVLALWAPVERLVAERRGVVTRALAAVGVAAVLAGAVGLVAGVGNPFTWAADQVSGGECVNDPGRLTELCDNNRLAWWGDAVEIAREHPVSGTGAGTYAIARLRVRDDATPVTEPHSVPLQLLADLGLVGLALGLAAAASAALSVGRSLRRLDGPDRWDATALAAVPVAFGLHALVDYDLEFLAMSAPALMATGALLAAGGSPRRVRVGLAEVLALTAVAAAALASLWLPALARDAVDEAYATEELTAAADAAARARSLDPLSLDPVFAQAYVAERAGDRRRAQELLEEATRMQPENPAPWLELGRFHYAADPRELCAAYVAFNAAYTLDPRSSRWIPGGPLDVARDAVDAGACEYE